MQLDTRPISNWKVVSYNDIAIIGSIVKQSIEDKLSANHKFPSDSGQIALLFIISIKFAYPGESICVYLSTWKHPQTARTKQFWQEELQGMPDAEDFAEQLIRVSQILILGFS